MGTCWRAELGWWRRGGERSEQGMWGSTSINDKILQSIIHGHGCKVHEP